MPTTFEVIGEVAHITLDYAPLHNGLDEVICAEILEALATADTSENLRFVALHGVPGWFCIGGGGDYLERAIRSELSLRVEFSRRVQRVVHALLSQGLFTVSVVDGLAAGAGVDLLFASDLVVATRNARLSLLYSKLGLVPDVGFALMERRLNGIDPLLMYAESAIMDATRMVAVGLAAETVIDPTDRTHLSTYLSRTYRHQAGAFRAAKNLRNHALRARLVEEMEMAAQLQAQAMENPATQARLLRSAGLQRQM